ncbi:MAG: hypothetical protein JWS12_235 [Candidatus Saccharibacteria bacterium]|nr:hypothetical protein [Candidatus Saccharibacteria bacterium]
MKKLNSKGFSAVEALLILIIVGVIGFVGWYVYKSQKDTNKTLNNTSQGASTPQKVTKTPTSSSPQSMTTTQKSLTVKEWGVQVPLDANTTDLYYTLNNSVASFRTKQLDTLLPSCTTNSVQVARGKATDTYPAPGTETSTFKEIYDSVMTSSDKTVHNIKPALIGDYYYIAPAEPGASCSAKSNGDAQETQTLANIRTVLNNIKQ